MKNRFIIISRFHVLGVLLGSLCLAGLAQGQETMRGGGMRGGAAQRGATPSQSQMNDMVQKSNASQKGKLSSGDKTFIMNAAKGGMMEVEWGKLAAQNAKSADVKKFGNRMVSDHTKVNNELMALAKEEGVSLPASKSAGKWKSDKDYMEMMVTDHEKVLAEFKNEASNGTDPDLKKFASKTSKAVEKHLAMARDINGKLK